MNHTAIPEAPECKSLEWAHPLVREWFVAKFGTPTEPQEQGWPHILAGQDHADLRAHGFRQNAGGVSRLHRPAGAQSPCGRSARSNRSALRLAAESARQRHSKESGHRRWAKSLQLAARARLSDAGNSHRRAHRRHADARAPRDAEAPAAHSGDHARIALHSAHGRKEPRNAAHA